MIGDSFINFKLDKDLHRAFKIYCINNNISIRDFLINKISGVINAEVEKNNLSRKNAND